MSFYMNFGAINEGKQAREYMKRKADEKHKEEMKDFCRTKDRYDRKQEDVYALGKCDMEKLAKTAVKYGKDMDRKYDNIKDDDYKSQIASAHAGLAALKRAEKDSGVKVQNQNLKKINSKYECGIFVEACFIDD